jgi:hypothetical protein
MRRWAVAIGLCVWAVVSLSATGTVTGTTSRDNGVPDEKITVTWVSHTDGTVSGNAFAIPGRINQIRITPAAGGSAPTTLYDMTILDATGIDVLSIDGSDLGANLSATASKLVIFNPPLLVDSANTLDVTIENAGSGKGGTVTFWVQR